MSDLAWDVIWTGIAVSFVVAALAALWIGAQ